MSDLEEADIERSEQNLVLWIVVPIAVVAGLLLLLLATRQPATERAERSALIGELAPSIAGTAVDGTPYDIDDERGRWVVVNFFSTTCVPCIAEHPELVAFEQDHRVVADATVVSVAFDDRPDNVREFFEENGGAWPVLVEGVGEIAVRYGVTGVPESYLVAPSGVVAAKFTGGIEQSDLDETIRDLEAAS